MVREWCVDGCVVIWGGNSVQKIRMCHRHWVVEVNFFRCRAIEGVHAAVGRAERLQDCRYPRVYACGKRCARVLVYHVVEDGPILPKKHGKRRSAKGIWGTRIRIERA